MKRSLRYLLFLCLFTFILSLARAVSAQDVVYSDEVENTIEEGHMQEPLLQETDQRNPYNGSEEVEEARHILSKIKKPVTYISKKPKGVLEKSLYYANELFTLLFLNTPISPSSSRFRRPSGPLANAVVLLQDAAQRDNPDAMFLLAEMNMYGNFTHQRNYTEAFERYHQLAALNGNSSAQHMVGFMYATGVGGAVQQDQAKAMLYYTFAADQGDIRAEMAIAYRHQAGISTPVSCDDAVRYYQHVADKAIDYIRSGPLGGHSIVKEAYRIADAEGGPYGEGASVSSSGVLAKQGGPQSDTYASFDDVMEYLDFLSRKGDLKARFNIAKFHYDGHRSMKRDVRAAKKQFMDIAKLYWDDKGRPRPDASAQAEKLATRAAGYLGRMFARGEGMPPNDLVARTWLKRGIANGDALSQYYMGLLYQKGSEKIPLEMDPLKAADYFSAAADQDLSAAQVKLGIMFLDQGDHASALRYFDLAARNKHVEALYYLSEMTYLGIGRDKSCAHAASLYKTTAEKAETIVAPIHEANVAWDEGDEETALLGYMLAAEQGFESAQANVAYILDQQRPPHYSLSALLPSITASLSSGFKVARGVANDASLALMMWARSASQDNSDSILKLGDYHHFGFGLSSHSSPDYEKAASCYMRAADGIPGSQPASAQAMWNLGWMHENGMGMEQDFHLAKRFYDQALETNKEAEFPVRLALGRLRVRSWWNKLTGGSVKNIDDDDSEKPKYTGLADWIKRFLENEAADYAAELEAEEAALREENPEDWEAGEMPGGDFVDEYLDDIDDNIVEMLIIGGLAAILATLVYWRNREQQRRQRQQQQQGQGQQPPEQQQPQQDNGMFPQPGNPAFLDWAAGAVGH